MLLHEGVEYKIGLKASVRRTSKAGFSIGGDRMQACRWIGEFRLLALSRKRSSTLPRYPHPSRKSFSASFSGYCICFQSAFRTRYQA